MEASIESSNAEVCCSEKELVNSEKKRTLLLQKRRAVLTISVYKQQNSEGIDLRISSTHSSLSTSEETSFTFQGNLEVLLLGKAFKLSAA